MNPHTSVAPHVHGSKTRFASRLLQHPFRATPKLVLPGPTRQHLTKSHPFPDPEEERGVTHDAFMQAVQQSKPASRISGLQEFAAAIWERKRRIPSTTYNDPLQHLFNEFDLDNDGCLTAAEVAAALQQRNVEVTEEVVQRYIDEIDTNNNGTVERHEWEHFIFHMASVDLRHANMASQEMTQDTPQPE